MNKKRVATEQELGQAVKDNAETIEITGDLRNKVLKIKATGKVAWAVAIGAIAISIVGILVSPASGGASATAGIVAAPAAIAALGAPVAVSAVAIAIAAGGVGALNKLRKYKVVSHDENTLVLRK